MVPPRASSVETRANSVPNGAGVRPPAAASDWESDNPARTEVDMARSAPVICGRTASILLAASNLPTRPPPAENPPRARTADSIVFRYSRFMAGMAQAVSAAQASPESRASRMGKRV